MKRFMLLALYFTCYILTTKSIAQVNMKDSVSLVNLYDSTNGTGWFTNTNWLTDSSVSTWYGITVEDNRVTKIYLASNGLKGTIPYSLSDLTNLQALTLFNNQLTDTIPASLGNLANLQKLYLDYNNLNGSVPALLGNLTNLNILYLEHNQLSDTIPASLGDLTNLIQLELDDNLLSGRIPASLGNLSNLTNLDLFNNQLNGSIPNSFTNLKSIRFINLNNNKLTGPLPSGFGNLFNLQYLFLGNNQLNGPIPPVLGNLNIKEIDLSYNHLSDTIPASIGNWTNADYFSVGYNNLTGYIPVSLGNLTHLNNLILNNNNLSGKIPSSLSNINILSTLDLHSNQLSDTIPASLNNLLNLNYLYLDTNNFTFNGMEQIAQTFDSTRAIYAPQHTIPLHLNGNTLSVSPGGTLANNIFHWYRNDALIKNAKGDSTLSITEGGSYHVAVKNTIATQLVLRSDTIYINTLAVTLNAFTAIKQNVSVLLNWQTASGNTNYFNVQRSNDGIHFNTIHNISAARNSTTLIKYSYRDEGIALQQGVLYYRIQEVDIDESETYSSIKPITFKTSIAFTVSPNPAADVVNILASANVTDALIKISDLSGKTLYAKKQNLIAGEPLKLPVSQFPANLLIININTAGYNTKFKIIKK